VLFIYRCFLPSESELVQQQEIVTKLLLQNLHNGESVCKFAIYLALFVTHSSRYLNFAKQEHWFLNLCHVGELRYMLECLWHILMVRKRICHGNYSNPFIAKIEKLNKIIGSQYTIVSNSLILFLN
jgi:hypothetical protein